MSEKRPRLVVLCNVVPVEHADNAGQVYVTTQVQQLRRRWDVRCLVFDGRSARTELELSLAPSTVIASSSTVRRWVAGKIDRLLRWSPSSPSRVQLQDLLGDGRSVAEIQDADVVMLHWQSYAMLAPAIRAISPHVMIVGVLHDVVSQGTERRSRAATSFGERTKLRVATWIARSHEKNLWRETDRLVVLSHKDLSLLPPRTRAITSVVPAPATFTSAEERAPRENRVLLVVNWRPENLDGLAWLLDEVWPHLVALGETPDVHMIGRGLGGPIVERARSRGFVERGFVEDLSHEYSQAAVAVVPLRLGAGVKFKTVEALAHGVPLATTSVGAEGIPLLQGCPEVTDDPRDFASRIAEILRNPEASEARAQELRVAAREAYSPEAMGRALDELLDFVTAPKS